jgi:hypothetical protein
MEAHSASIVQALALGLPWQTEATQMRGVHSLVWVQGLPVPRVPQAPPMHVAGGTQSPSPAHADKQVSPLHL